ncbi:hypothetical protein CO614_09150 [Lysobacteraceae bacterium NML120232]|nr:hypothetical protein CO614_09150 [Xanthomonadaceae bacterium NML120232]
MRIAKIPLILAAALLIGGCPLGKKSESADAGEKSPPVSEKTAAAMLEAAPEATPTCDCNNEAAAAVPVAELPERFRGLWDARCDSRGDTHLAMEKNSITMVENGGEIRAVVQKGRNEVAIIADMRGEGGEWILLRHFELSEDGQELMDVTDDDNYFLRRKCEDMG